MEYSELIKAYREYESKRENEEIKIQDTIQDLIGELLQKGFRLCYQDDYVFPEKFYLEIEVD